MQVYDYNAYPWNHGCAPHGNLGRVDPQRLADLCDEYNIPWYSSGWPYASGLSLYCEDFDLFSKLIHMARDRE